MPQPSKTSIKLNYLILSLLYIGEILYSKCRVDHIGGNQRLALFTTLSLNIHKEVKIDLYYYRFPVQQ